MDDEVQFENVVGQKSGLPYALRIFPRGGKRKGAGNITFYVQGGYADILGNEKARVQLRGLVRDWTVHAGS